MLGWKTYSNLLRNLNPFKTQIVQKLPVHRCDHPVLSARWRNWVAESNMASANETVLLKSTLEIQNKAYSVKLTASEIYWETITSARAASGPYSEPLVSKYLAIQ